MKSISEMMTTGVRSLSPSDTLQSAAQAMEALDIGSVPVCDGQRLVGMVTDRDIAIRAIAQGLPAQSTTVSQVMSGDVKWCYEDQTVEEATYLMQQAQIRRLPVVDRDKRLVGMLALGDVSVKADAAQAASALQGISNPSEPDRSNLSAAAGQAGGGADAQTKV